jgi:hypothetical protein
MTTTCTDEGRLKSLACNDFGLVCPLLPQLGTSFTSFGHHWYRSSPSSLPWSSCASISCVEPSWDQRLEGDVVSSLVPGASQYAVISVRAEPRCERVVIAYFDEKSLRNLLAAPSILGLGYRSREEAQVNIDCCTTTPYPSRRKLTAASVTTTRTLKRFVANHEFPRSECKLARAWGIIRKLLQHSVTIAIAALYSKNILSAAVRAVISL